MSKGAKSDIRHGAAATQSTNQVSLHAHLSRKIVFPAKLIKANYVVHSLLPLHQRKRREHPYFKPLHQERCLFSINLQTPPVRLLLPSIASTLGLHTFNTSAAGSWSWTEFTFSAALTRDVTRERGEEQARRAAVSCQIE